jgi:predicted PurR-regulated permease PerM
MNTLILIMIVFAVLLIIVSFIIPDHSKQVKNDLDQLSIQLYQETYQIKKRLKVLEEELLLPNSNTSDDHTSSKKVNPIIVNQVRLLKQQGLTVEQIAKQSALTTDEVNKILKDEGWDKNE